MRIVLALLLLISTLAAPGPAPASTMENCGCAMPEGRCCCAPERGPVSGPSFDACPCIGPDSPTPEAESSALLPTDTTQVSGDAHANRVGDRALNADVHLPLSHVAYSDASPSAATAQATLCTWRC